MRLLVKTIMLCLCFNMASWILSTTNVAWISGFNVSTTPADLIDKFDVNATASGWSGDISERFFGYIFDGTKLLMNFVMTTVLGFPGMMADLGAPDFIVQPLYALWSFLFLVFFIELITGRDLTP